MRFIETPIFTEAVCELFQDDEYRRLQGAVIRGGGGLRKVRWGTKGRGKRGGIRVVREEFK